MGEIGDSHICAVRRRSGAALSAVALLAAEDGLGPSPHMLCLMAHASDPIMGTLLPTQKGLHGANIGNIGDDLGVLAF